jgi:hypothetical protein
MNVKPKRVSVKEDKRGAGRASGLDCAKRGK